MATVSNRRWPFPALLGMLWLACGHADAEVSLEVTPDRTDIFLGEAVNLQIVVRGTGEAEEPDFSDLQHGTVVRGGSGRSYSIDRGAISQSVSFSATVTPTRAGEQVLGPIRVSAGGAMLTARGPTIRVRGMEPQDRVFIEIGASRESVILDEFFEVDVSIRIRALPPPYDKHDPLDPGNPPHLSVPFFTPPDGLSVAPVQPYLQQQVVQRRDQPGFTLNDYKFQMDPVMNLMNFGIMQNEMIARFMFPRRTVDLPGGRFHIYDIRLTYQARKEGSYTFGPVEFRGNTITEVGPGGQAGTMPVLAIATPVTVRVTPPPTQGRPPSFVGAVGSNLTAAAALDTQTCNVGDPLTLTLDIRGDVVLDNLTAPVLSDQPAMREHFRVYDDTVRTESHANGRTYRYTLRPTRAGTFELPPIAVSYYDSLARAYRTVETTPIPVRANESAQVAGGMILSTATNGPVSVVFSGTRSGAPPAPLTMDPNGARPAPLLRWSVHGVIGLFGPAAFALTLAARGTRRTLRHIAEHAHPRDARRAAEAALARAAREPDAGRRGQAVRAALTTYLATRLRVPGQGLTPDEAHRLLAAVPTVAPELAARYHALDQQLFHAQFTRGTTPGAAADTATQARTLIRELDAALRGAPRRPTAAHRALFLLALLAAAVPSSASAASRPDASTQFMWDRANARLASAQSPDDFAESAALYQDLVRAGLRNGPLFYNLGVACLEADQPAAALNAFLRAERLVGARPEIRQNIACALAATEGDGPASLLPTYRILLFWHYGLGLSLRLALALGGLSLVVFAITLRLWRWHALAPPVLTLGAILLILFGTSVGASLHAESVDDARMRDLPQSTPIASPHDAA